MTHTTHGGNSIHSVRGDFASLTSPVRPVRRSLAVCTDRHGPGLSSVACAPRAQNEMTVVSFPLLDVRSVHCFGTSSAQYTNTLNPDHGPNTAVPTTMTSCAYWRWRGDQEPHPPGASECMECLLLGHCHRKGGSWLCAASKALGLGERHTSGHLAVSVQRPHPSLGKGLRVFVLSTPSEQRNSEHRCKSIRKPAPIPAETPASN